MKQYLLIILFLFSNQVFAASYNPINKAVSSQSEYSQIVVDSLWEQLGHAEPAPIPVRKETKRLPEPTPDVSPEPAKKEIVKIDPSKKGKLKPPSKVTFPDNKKEPKKKGPLKIDGHTGKIDGHAGKLNRDKDPLAKYRNKNQSGNNKIQEMLKRNREKLKQRQANEKQIANNSKKEESLQDLRNKGLNQLKKQVNTTYKNWQEQVKETYRRWAKQKKVYEKKIPQYKEATFEFGSALGSSKNAKSKMSKPMTSAVKDEYHIIPGSLDVPIRDQGRRPTCAAFAGVRAIETLLMGHDVETDLSEQWFYWSSKPRCQSSPCNQRGSWISNAYKNSKRSSSPDIPLDQACPYQSTSVSGNETQIPLRPSCRQGVAKVNGYSQLDSITEVYQSISKNRPVVGGFKLSPNFYKTNGLVTLRDSYTSGATDSHAAGHALLVIGHMQLPKEMHSKEGKFCLIVANSWGEGWGKGGFGCLTEKWVQNYSIPNAFMSLNGVKM